MSSMKLPELSGQKYSLHDHQSIFLFTCVINNCSNALRIVNLIDSSTDSTTKMRNYPRAKNQSIFGVARNNRWFQYKNAAKPQFVCKFVALDESIIFSFNFHIVSLIFQPATIGVLLSTNVQVSTKWMNLCRLNIA